MQDYIIGIDIGTGSTKAVAVNTRGDIIGTTQIHHSYIKTIDEHAEQDPALLLNAFYSCIKRLISDLGNLPSGISLSSAMHSIMAINEEGKPITNLILWSDNRSTKIAQQLRNDRSGQTIYKDTGTPIHAMSPLCKIIWWRENEKETFSKAYKFISIKEFIWYCLFKEYAIDHSIASATGLFNIDTLSWNTESLQMAQITTDHLSFPVPTVYHKTGIEKEACKLSGLTPLIPVCIGASDGCLANLGTHSLKKGIAAITIGTSAAVRIASAVPIRNSANMIFNYILDYQTFICGGPINNGGNVMDWIISNFLSSQELGEDPYPRIFEIINKIPAGSEGLLFLPYIFAERSPVWDEKASGGFIGIKQVHTQAHFINSVIEGICFALKEVLEIIENASGEIKEIYASGAFSKSRDWVQLLANVINKPVVLSEIEDASAIGAAMLGYAALGIKNEINHIQAQSIVIRPEESNAEVYSAFFAVYKTMYAGMKPTMDLLYKTLN
jgi:gluconokinase